MKVKYRGHEIDVKWERCLGGWDQLYMSVFRNDGLEVVCEFADSADPVREVVKWMKGRVDEAIASRGESEFLRLEWGEWKEPS